MEKGKEIHRERQREVFGWGKKDLSFVGPPIKFLKRLEVGQTKARSLKLNPNLLCGYQDPSTSVIICSIPGCTLAEGHMETQLRLEPRVSQEVSLLLCKMPGPRMEFALLLNFCNTYLASTAKDRNFPASKCLALTNHQLMTSIC